MTDGRTSFTTTVRVIAGVHYRTANGRTDTLVTGLTCFTNLNGIVLNVTYLTNGCFAIETNALYLSLSIKWIRQNLPVKPQSGMMRS